MYDHTIISVAQADQKYQLTERFKFRFPEWLSEDDPVIVFKGATRFEDLNEKDINALASFIVIDGDLTVHHEVELYDAESVSGMLVLGNASMETLVMGDTEIYITGNLDVRKYIHTPRPQFEQGTLVAKGTTQVPIIVQEDYNPYIQVTPSARYCGPEGLYDLKNDDSVKDALFDDGVLHVEKLIEFLNVQDKT